MLLLWMLPLFMDFVYCPRCYFLELLPLIMDFIVLDIVVEHASFFMYFANLIVQDATFGDTSFIYELC